MEHVKSLQHQEPFYWKEPSCKREVVARLVVATDDIVCLPWTTLGDSEPHQFVQFSNVITIIGTSCSPEAAWYSKSDSKGFFKQAQIQARMIQMEEHASTDPFYWTKSLTRIVESFETNETEKAASMVLLRSNRIVIDERFVGLESMSVPHVSQSLLTRRQELVRQILTLQDKPEYESDVRAELMCKISVKQSRVSVLFAHYIAKQNARRLLVDKVVMAHPFFNLHTETEC